MSYIPTQTLPAYYIPDKIWAQEGQQIKINPWGMIAKNPSRTDFDAIIRYQRANEDSMTITPAAGQNDLAVNIDLRNSQGNLQRVGTSTLKITHTTQSPAVAQNFICIGDSTTFGTGTSTSQEGAWVNECSRRLNGVGLEILPTVSYPAGSLTNIYFRGTLGDQAVKHEGRGGWGFQNYLQSASFLSDTNAFWNAGTSSFDLNFYLNANNFLDGQTTGGVLADGSNLTIIIQLGWNHVYNVTTAQVNTWARQLIDIIHTQKPLAKVKLLGLACPPPLNYNNFSGLPTARTVSPENIMIEAVIAYANLYNSISKDPLYSSFVEYIHVSSVFFPEFSYATSAQRIHMRTATTRTYYTEYIHPNSTGYAQIADAVFYNILYNYCRLT